MSTDEDLEYTKYENLTYFMSIDIGEIPTRLDFRLLILAKSVIVQL